MPESAVEALDVGEDALPVGLLHPHHVLHVEQGADVAVFPEFEAQVINNHGFLRSWVNLAPYVI